MMRSISCLIVVAAALPACSGPSIEESIGEEEGSVVGGEDSHLMAAVGALRRLNGASQCTATVISSRVILTAAHCLNNFDDTKSGFASAGEWPSFSTKVNYQFFMRSTDGSATATRYVLRYKVLSTGTGADDLGIAELNEDVPGWVIPRNVAQKAPALGETVTAYGYGVNERSFNKKTGKIDDGTGHGKKRRISWAWTGYTKDNPDKKNLNAPGLGPGDSGAPIFNDANEIVAVESGYDATTKKKVVDGTTTYEFVSLDREIYANPVKHRTEIGMWRTRYGIKELCPACLKVNLETSDGHYVVAENGGGGVVRANRTKAAEWETFRLVPLGNSYFALQTSKGNFLSADYCGGASVHAKAMWLRECETFELVGSTGLRAWHDQFVGAQNGGGGAVTATATAQGDWETFTLYLRY